MKDLRRTSLVTAAIAAVALMLVAQAFTSAGPANAAAKPCRRPAHAFVPAYARIPALNKTVRVIQVERNRDGSVGAGPTTTEGKWLMAMDPHNKAGSRKGSILLSGHTWPDGSALGNAMLRDLKAGHRYLLIGKNGQQACYTIKERTSYPANEVPRNKAFRYWGPEQAVIVACSGKRLGPGRWTRRTIWYAVPYVDPAPQTPPPSPEPPDDGSDGGLLGGLIGGLL